jgi:hypothetical protein
MGKSCRVAVCEDSQKVSSVEKQEYFSRSFGVRSRLKRLSSVVYRQLVTRLGLRGGGVEKQRIALMKRPVQPFLHMTAGLWQTDAPAVKA